MIHPLRCAARFLTVLVLLLASQVAAQQMVSVSGMEVNLRSGPGTQHPSEWVLDRGFPLQVVGKSGSWLRVRDFENDGGWIHRSFTSSAAYHIVKVKIANMRSQPTTRSSIVAKLAYGDVLRTLERRNDWVRVRQRDGGLRGWVARRLLWGW